MRRKIMELHGHGEIISRCSFTQKHAVLHCDHNVIWEVFFCSCVIGSLLILSKCQHLTDDAASKTLAPLWDFSLKLRVISRLAVACKMAPGSHRTVQSVTRLISRNHDLD